MVQISEWLPNPTGSDAEGEWVELWNPGPGAADLSSWRLIAGTGKGYALQGVQLGAGERIVLYRRTTKLALKNTDGSLMLVNAEGVEIDHAVFVGTALEGKSANRDAVGRAFFAAPTPGAPNARPSLALIGNTAPDLGIIRSAVSGWETTLVGATCALAFVCAALFIIKKNHVLEELFIRSH